MNELGTIKPVPLAANQRGSTLPSKASDGKKLPAEPVQSTSTPASITGEPPQAPKGNAKQLEKAVDSMNNYVQTVKRDLQFSVDQELNQTVIKVLDSSTGKLIRQIPDDIFLELARKVKETGQMNLLHATG